MMNEEKKPNIIYRGFKKILEYVFIFILALIFSIWLGKNIDCESTNLFVMQNLWEGGIGCEQ